MYVDVKTARERKKKPIYRKSSYFSLPCFVRFFVRVLNERLIQALKKV